MANLVATSKPQALRDRQRDVNDSRKGSRLERTTADHEEQAEPEQRHPDPEVRTGVEFFERVLNFCL